MQNLIIEADEIKTVKGKNYEKYGAVFDAYELDEKLAAKCGRKAGNYLTVQTDGGSQTEKALYHALHSFVKRGKKALVAGFGNGDVVADALDNKVVEILKTRNLQDGRISVFAPDVGALTNLDSVKLVKAVADGFSPDYVIAVDALATAKTERLGACYQFTDGALRPGGGVGKGETLDAKTLKTRFIAIGVPFIINSADICAGADRGYFVPYDVDERVKTCAEFIAGAIFDCFS